MTAIAIIPVRGGSKGIPAKNMQVVGGRSLTARAVAAAKSVPAIGQVYVTTDDSVIAAEAARAGADVIERPAELAADSSTSESALLHALGVIGDGIDTIVFIQATSPFIDVTALARAVDRVQSGESDVAFSVVESHDFSWRVHDGRVEAVGHDQAHRPRRQDREPLFRETGAFYVMRRDGFVEHEHRFFGRLALEEVAANTAMEIDTFDDLALARALADRVDQTLPPEVVPKVTAVVTDFDGVHTDDHAWVDASGNEMVMVHRGDGLGIGQLRRSGIPLLILSKETNPVVQARAKKLGVECWNAIDEKDEALSFWAQTHEIPLAEIAYLGNDINDLPAMALAGYSVAVADAHPRVRAAADHVLRSAGGHGAIRELIDFLFPDLGEQIPHPYARPQYIVAHGS